jgi:hypothetical protein
MILINPRRHQRESPTVIRTIHSLREVVILTRVILHNHIRDLTILTHNNRQVMVMDIATITEEWDKLLRQTHTVDIHQLPRILPTTDIDRSTQVNTHNRRATLIPE